MIARTSRYLSWKKTKIRAGDGFGFFLFLLLVVFSNFCVFKTRTESVVKMRTVNINIFTKNFVIEYITRACNTRRAGSGAGAAKNAGFHT